MGIVYSDKLTGRTYKLGNEGLQNMEKDRESLGMLREKKKYQTLYEHLRKRSRFSMMMGFRLNKMVDRYSISLPSKLKLKEGSKAYKEKVKQIKGEIKNILNYVVIVNKFPIPKAVLGHVIGRLIKPVSEGFTQVYGLTKPNILDLSRPNRKKNDTIYSVNLWSTY